MKPLFLPRQALVRVLASLLRDVMGKEQPRQGASFSSRTSLGEDGLALDSIDLVEAAGRVNQMFRLAETGIEDYLLVRRTLGAWADLIERAWEQGERRITFLTSGSTGEPKPCTHSFAPLEQEVAALADLFAGQQRIVALAPAHHIYGFLFTVLLPERLGVPVVEGESWSRLARQLRPGDLVVTFPLRWRYLARSLRRVPRGVRGVTSTAPCEASTIEQLGDRGLERMTEVYGSSETAGVGYRHDPQAPYRLFPFWTRKEAADESVLVRTRPDGSSALPRSPMDHLEWQGERCFRPAGRRDEGVQVAGTNVFPRDIARQLRAHPQVKQATVRQAPPGSGRPGAHPGERRLEAVVTPAPGRTENELHRTLNQWMRQYLPAPARPRLLTSKEEKPHRAGGDGA